MKKTLLLFLLLPFLGFAQLAVGTHIINDSQPAPYKSLQDAITSLNLGGIAGIGKVTLLLDQDQTVNSTIIINRSDLSASKTLTIKPNTSKTIIISGRASNTSLIKLDGADYITIDGSNTPDGTTKDLTIKNTVESNYNSESIIWIGSSSSSNGSEKNLIKNINFTGNSTSNNSTVLNGIVFSSSSSMDILEDTSNSDNTIQNNTFSKIRYAINVKGNSTTYSKNLTISDNTFGSSGNEILVSSIRIENGQNYSITKNTIAGMIRTDNSFRLSGILLEGNSNIGNISNNIIKEIFHNGGSRATGIYINLKIAYNAGLTISNNFISDIRTSNTNTNDYDNSSSGIYIYGGKQINIFYNTISLNKTQTGFSSALVALIAGTKDGNAGASALNIKNNIFSNFNTAGTRYALYANINKTDFTDIDYNNYKTNTGGNIASFSNIVVNTIPDLQTQIGKNTYSLALTPNFISTTDFHLASNNSNNELLKGSLISEVTTDIDGDTRIKPYMGADEIACTAPIISQQPSTPTTTCSGSGEQNLSVTAIGTGLTYVWKKDGTAVTNGSVITGQGTNALKLTKATIADQGSYTVVVSNGCSPDATSTGVTVTVNPILTASVSIVSDQPTKFCQGTGVRFNATPTNGGSAPTYQWYKNNIAITNQTANTILFFDLADGDKVKVVLTSSNTTPCLTGIPATSNEIQVAVYMTDRGFTSGGKHICLGSPSPLLKLYNSNGPANTPYTDRDKIIYWQYSDDNVTWVNFDDANTKGKIEYQPPVLSASRSYRAVAQTQTPSDGPCPITDKAVETRIDVDPLPSVTFTSAPGEDTLIGSDFTYTTQTSGLNYLWTVSGTLNTDYKIISGSLSNTSNTVILRWLTLGDKTVTVNYKNTFGCDATTPASSTTRVHALPAPPTPGLVAQPTCNEATGSITLNDLPASGQLLLNGPNSINSTYTITGSSLTISGLVPGDYTFAIKLAGTTTTYTNIITIKQANKWDGTKWSYGNSDPSINDILIFEADYTLDKDVNGCSCTISNGANVKIQSDRTLTITNSLNINSGSLEFMNNASLVQTNNNAINTGNIIYYRDTQPIRRYDFTYWSSPVTEASGFTLHDLSPDTLLDKYNSYDAQNAKWIYYLNGAQKMIPTVGYTVRAPQPYSITDTQIYHAKFTGIPNNGIYHTEQIYAGKWSLIGNPYPSAIDADKLVSINQTAGVNIGAIYFWTHNSAAIAANPSNGTTSYTSNDYAVYSKTGGISTSKGASTDTTKNTEPLGKIAAGQSFFILGSGPDVITFTNDMRVGGSNKQFFKTTDANTTEKSRLWLNLTNSAGAFKQALVGYIDGATNDWDINYDAKTINGNSFVDFYSINEANKLAIQGRALPFDDTDRVPLGYKTTIEGSFTIAIDHADGVFNNQLVYLEDKTTGTIQDLTAGDYTFTSAIGTFTDRFTISYVKKTLGTGDFENLENTALVSVKNKTIKVTSTKETINEVTIYDISGRTLFNKKKVGSNELQISNLQSSNQVLLVKVTLENDYVVTKKIIFQ